MTVSLILLRTAQNKPLLLSPKIFLTIIHYCVIVDSYCSTSLISLKTHVNSVDKKNRKICHFVKSKQKDQTPWCWLSRRFWKCCTYFNICMGRVGRFYVKTEIYMKSPYATSQLYEIWLTEYLTLSNSVDEVLPFVEGYNVRVKPVKIFFAYRRCYCSQFKYQR